MAETRVSACIVHTYDGCSAETLADAPTKLTASNFTAPVLFVADLFHPVHGLAIELFLNRDMRHGSGGSGAVPMLLARREPDHVTGTSFLNRPSPALREAATRGHDEGLAQRVRVPCGPGAGF